MDLESASASSASTQSSVGRPLYSVAFGVAAAVLGVLDGFVMLVKGLQSPCSKYGVCDTAVAGNGYPHPSVGLAVMAVSFMLGILVYLAGRIVHSLRTGSPARGV